MLLALAMTGARFGVRPSRLIGLMDEATALDFDMAAAFRLNTHEAELEAEKWSTSGHH